MLKSYANPVDYKIPERLKFLIKAIILGESENEVNTRVPIHPTSFPLLVYVYDDTPVFYIDGKKFIPESKLNIAGLLYDVTMESELKGKIGQLGFLLSPAAPYYLFHKKGEYFLNHWKPLEKIAPIDTSILKMNLLKCNTNHERIEVIFNLMDELVTQSIPKIVWLEQAIDIIINKGGVISQKELSNQLQISERHFRRKFKEVVGVPPKYFCKVVQLNSLFDLINRNENEKLIGYALDCGYYDQAHFINDFKKLIGSCPEDFLNGRYAYVKTYLGKR